MERHLFLLGISFVFFVQTFANSGVPQIKGNREIQVTVNEGETATLDCPVERMPNLIIEWYKDGRIVDHQILNAFKIFRKGTLVIYNVTQDEAGTYVCKAINGFGTVDVSISLQVHDKETSDEVFSQDRSSFSETNGGQSTGDSHSGSKPSFIKSPSPQKSVIQKPVSSPVHLKCAATGYPSPSVQWFKNGQELKPEKNSVDIKKWSLYLRLRKNDSGEYMCVVKNVYGVINATFSIDVIVPGPRQPELTELKPLNTTVEYGGIANFHCRVKSDAVPHIQWLKRVEDATPSKNFVEFEGSYFKVLKQSEAVEREEGLYLNKLMLSEVKESDSGMYVCFAANTMGYSYKEALLTVQPDKKHLEHNPWAETDVTMESSGIGSFSITLIICIPLTVIAVVLVVYMLVRCRTNYSNSVSNNKRIDRSSPCTANSGTRYPTNRASSSSSCAFSKNGNCVHKPIFNGEPQSDLSYSPQVAAMPVPSSWNSQMPPHHYRKSGTATPSSSTGETRSGASISIPKVHHHHHQYRYHHQHIYCS